MCHGVTAAAACETDSPDSPKSSPYHKIGLGMMANICDRNKKKVTVICGERIDLFHMVRNTKLMSEIPARRPLG